MNGFTRVVRILMLLAVGVTLIDSKTNLAKLIRHDGEDGIAGCFIVKYKEHEPDENFDDGLHAAQEIHKSSEESAESAEFQEKFAHRHDFKKFKGFFMDNVTEADIDALRSVSNVAYVEQVQIIRNTSLPWGVDRVDQRDVPLDNAFNALGTGSGVDIYVVDSGVYTEHQDFGERASIGSDFINGDTSSDKCLSHGTRVAGVAAGTEYGVAKEANIISVRMLNCTGYGTSLTFIDAMDWIVDNHNGPSVVSLSLGARKSQSIDDAVMEVIKAGITVVVAAGNADTNACDKSPARVPQAITVGATTISDEIAEFSNYGTCVDIFAPGVNIPSASTGSLTATKSGSGTSFAVPHVSGAVAILLSQNPDLSVADVTTNLLNMATQGAITNLGATGSPNRLLYIGVDYSVEDSSTLSSSNTVSSVTTSSSVSNNSYSGNVDTVCALMGQCQTLKILTATITPYGSESTDAVDDKAIEDAAGGIILDNAEENGAMDNAEYIP